MIFDCPDTLYGLHGLPDKNGHCSYCKKKIEAKNHRPRLNPNISSELDIAYDYFYDPNFGTGR